MTEWRSDFRVPDAKEWPKLKAEFIAGLHEARRIAATTPVEHQMTSEALARETLIRIAVHAAYHLGQLNLLRRTLRRGNSGY